MTKSGKVLEALRGSAGGVASVGAHTPAPWSRVPQSSGGDLIAREFETGKQMNPKGLRIVCFMMARGTSLTEDGANSNLVAAAPELLAGLQGTLKLLRKAQDVLTMYLHPDSYDADHAVNLLLELLDGPEQRAIETPARAAIAKAVGAP